MSEKTLLRDIPYIEIDSWKELMTLMESKKIADYHIHTKEKLIWAFVERMDMVK